MYWIDLGEFDPSKGLRLEMHEAWTAFQRLSKCESIAFHKLLGTYWKRRPVSVGMERSSQDR